MVIGVVLTLALVSIVGIAFAHADGTKDWKGMHKESYDGEMTGCGMHNSMTDEQKEEFFSEMTEFKKQGSEWKNIKMKMYSLFGKSWAGQYKGGCGMHKYMDKDKMEGCPFHQE